jgi:uncharacterized membrane protein YqjE
VIYLLRLPRALILIGLTLWLAGIGILVLSMNIFWAALTSTTWREALDRVGTLRERSHR